MIRALLLAALAILVLGVGAATGQTDPRLLDAVRTAQEGRSDSARSVVRRLLAATAPTDSLYPEILYTQAMVAGEAGEMRRDLQRVAVEYSASSWADDALLRLVQMDYATRSLDGAARNLERLRLDYPLTPLLPQAAYWAARTYFDLKNSELACRWLTDGIARAQDLELRNQLAYLQQRCGAPEQRPAGADTAGAVAGKDSVPAPPVAAAPARYRVQVSAVATPGAAADAAGKVERLGYQAVIVRERGLYKVRAGAFATREEAQAAVPKLKAAFGGNPFLIAEP